ncbi:rRNA pseudouridine synthase [bacterium]|nr:rRNA pseudouridine synthase [bacterium]
MQPSKKTSIRLEEFVTAQLSQSRREVVDLIITGKVNVNGNPVRDISSMIDSDRDVVHVDGERLMNNLVYHYYKFHKPAGVISTLDDPNGRNCLKDFMNNVPQSLAPVGRLDRDSEGVMIFTNNGQLALAMSHPRYEVQKQYRVTLDKKLSQPHFDRLTSGCFLDDGPIVFDQVDWVSDVTVLVKISEGRNRVIRRTFELFGYRVKKLLRLSMGPIQLGKLGAGKFAKLTSGELRQLDQIIKLR